MEVEVGDIWSITRFTKNHHYRDKCLMSADLIDIVISVILMFYSSNMIENEKIIEINCLGP